MDLQESLYITVKGFTVVAVGVGLFVATVAAKNPQLPISLWEKYGEPGAIYVSPSRLLDGPRYLEAASGIVNLLPSGAGLDHPRIPAPQVVISRAPFQAPY